MGWQRFGRSPSSYGGENDMASGYGLSGYGSAANSFQMEQYENAGSPYEITADSGSQSDCYGLGLDRDTYHRVVVMPSTFLSIILALLLCSMYSRYKQGKPVTPFCGCPYTSVPASYAASTAPAGSAPPASGHISGEVAGSYVSGVGTAPPSVVATLSVPPGSVPPSGSVIGSAPPGSVSVPPGSVSVPPGSLPPGSLPPGSMPGSVAPASLPPGSMASGGPSAAGSTIVHVSSVGPAAPATPPPAAPAPAPAPAPEKADGKKEELPYERVPTPGVTPYLWSPPATIFQPSPTPPGTPFVDGSPAAGAAEDMDDEAMAGEDGYYRRRHGLDDSRR